MGDDYTIDLTVGAGSESGTFNTAVMYETEDDTSWTGTITENTWSLDAGETQTETIEIEPPDVGEFSFGLLTDEEEVVEEWDLTVTRPQVGWGETVSYYNGVDVTVDTQFRDTLEVTVVDMWGEEIGEYTVRPEGGKWVEATVTVENTIENDVYPPKYGDFGGLGAGRQLDKPKSPTVYYEFTEFEVLEDESFSEGDEFVLADKEGYYEPPGTMIPGSYSEGWIMFTTDTETTLEELSIRVQRDDPRSGRSYIRATWQSDQ